MRLALIADIHANLAALETVLDAIRRQSVDQILCLGDVIGYHPEAAPCVDLVRACGADTVAGNHERFVTGERAPRSVSPAVLEGVELSRDALGPERLAWMSALPERRVDDAGFIAVHGCLLGDSVGGYVTPSMVEANLVALVERQGPRIAFCGHTHAPLVSVLLDDGIVEPDTRSGFRWPSTARAVLVNPGSVGQPRDGDPRASFAVVDLEMRTVRIHRLEYGISRTIRAIESAGLPQELARRLLEGR